MKLIWKGKFESMDQLPIGELPENAVRFREPETPAKLSMVASLFLIPVLFLLIAAVVVKILLGFTKGDYTLYNPWGWVLALAMILPHEVLHAVAFPKHAEVQVWYSLKNMMAFVVSTCPTSKARFIFLSLLPNLVFGFVPLLIWMFVPDEQRQLSGLLFSFAAFSLMMGVGDFLNIFNALTQMPKNSITQLSGFHSYWYMPEHRKNI